ncbi:MAG: hypothetical protein M0C28_29305 [Candidatus Moduliflexus flocculans]|nr:hypothetical protein [Candidatus Moduliflexus flocculans]
MLVLAELLFPAILSAATLAAMDATTAPGPVMPLTATLWVLVHRRGSPFPPSVPRSSYSPRHLTSPVTNPLTASLKTTVKLIGEPLVGSA